MTSEILMPALSPTMEEGTLAKWLVKEKGKIEQLQILDAFMKKFKFFFYQFLA